MDCSNEYEEDRREKIQFSRRKESAPGEEPTVVESGENVVTRYRYGFYDDDYLTPVTTPLPVDPPEPLPERPDISRRVVKTPAPQLHGSLDAVARITGVAFQAYINTKPLAGGLQAFFTTAASVSSFAAVEDVDRGHTEGIFGTDADGDGWVDGFFGSRVQAFVWGRFQADRSQRNDRILQVGDGLTWKGKKTHDALKEAAGKIEELFADVAKEVALELTTAGVGAWLSKVDNVNDLRKISKAQKGKFAKPLLTRIAKLEYPFSKKNFRKNLAILYDISPPPAGYDAHHVFPQTLIKQFKKRVPDIDIHNPAFGAWWEQSAHRSKGVAYEQRWRKFLRNDHTVEEATNYGKELAKEFDFDWAY